MKTERRCYERPKTETIKVEPAKMIATSGGNVTVSGWGNGGSLGGGEAEEGTAAHRREWGNLWSNN